MSGLGLVLRQSLARLRGRPMRTGLSLLGIASGVALVFAVEAINLSPVSSYRELERSLAGRADLYVAARSPAGIDTGAVGRVERVPGVEAAAPVSEHAVRISAGSRTVTLGLFGVDERLRRLASAGSPEELERGGGAGAIGLYLTPNAADRLSARAGDSVTVSYGDRTTRTLVTHVLDEDQAQELAGLPVAIAPLGLAQDVTGTPGRLTRVLVALRPDAPLAAHGAIARAAGETATVASIGSESRLFADASALDRMAASMFGAVCLLVGVLIVYNASLLSMLERRREVAILRAIGAERRVLLGAALAETTIVGLVGAAAGVVLGRLALLLVSTDTPAYLRAAFPVQPDLVVPAWLVAASLGVGVVAALLGTLLPTIQLLRTPPAHAFEQEALAGSQRDRSAPPARLAVVAVALAGAGTAVTLAAPELALPGLLAFVAGGALLLLVVVPRAIGLLRRLLPRPAGALELGVAELTALPGRAIATASIGALTVLALVSIGGSLRNLEHGTDTVVAESLRGADLWVAVEGPENVFWTRTFDSRWRDRLEEVPGVESAQAFRSQFLDFRGHRVLAFGYERAREPYVTEAQLVNGDADALVAGLTGPDEVALSEALARDAGLEPGDRFDLPAPAGTRRVRLVATITNFGWQGGAVAMSAATFARLWGSDDVTAVGLGLAPGADSAATRRAVAALTGPGSRLAVSTSAEVRAETAEITSEGLSRLRRMLGVVVLAAFLAVGAAMLTSMAQRRRRLAGLRAVGMSSRQVYGALVAEVGSVLALGAVLGLVVGLGAQALAAYWVKWLVGYPIHFSVAAGTFALVGLLVVALAVVAAAVATASIVRRPIALSLAHE